MKIRAIKDEHYEIDEEHGTIKFLVNRLRVENWGCEIYRVPLTTSVASECGSKRDYIDYRKMQFIVYFERTMNLVGEAILLAAVKREIIKLGYDILDARVVIIDNVDTPKGLIMRVASEAFVIKKE